MALPGQLRREPLNMIPTLTSALRQIRDDLADRLEPLALRDLCQSLGCRWRDRILDPVTTIHLFILQVLHRNTACAHLPRLTGLDFTASAYCQARSRLPLAVLQALLRRLIETCKPLTDTVGLWHGHRTWLVDGTGVSMPDRPDLQRAFGQPTNQALGCGFPVARVLALFHAGTGLLQHVLTAPLCSHEMSRVALLHPELRAGDVLVGDRAFGTFAHLALLVGRGLHGVFRMSQRRVVDFTPDRPRPPRWNTPKLTGRARSRWVRALGPTDQVVEWYKPYVRPVWMTADEYAALPVTLTVRECQYQVTQPGFRVRTITLVTTLIDADAYPADELAMLYFQRWEVETDFAHLKTTLGMDVLHCETEGGVLKELTIYAIVYNLVRVVMLEAGRRQGVPLDRISFVDALRWLSSSPPGTPLPELVVNPHRPGRAEPRCKKRRAKKHPYMIHPRRVLRQRLLNQRVPA
jgi:Transposase DDE domain